MATIDIVLVFLIGFSVGAVAAATLIMVLVALGALNDRNKI